MKHQRAIFHEFLPLCDDVALQRAATFVTHLAPRRPRAGCSAHTPRETDYIKNPKPNGHRSLRLIVTVPVFLSDRTERVNAEIQVRTIAMDFWATLEHELAYGLADGGRVETVGRELKACADVIADTDLRMQALYGMVVRPNGGTAKGVKWT